MSNNFQKLSETFSLIPLNGKIPNEPSWSRWCTEKRPFDTDDFRGRNAGICCGPASGILALDIDDEEKFSIYQEKHHLTLPATRTHKTGKGGSHYLYAYPQDGRHYGNRAFKKEGFDIRGTGGQIVAPGSVHPDTGKMYVVSDESPIAQAPEWLAALAMIDNVSTAPASANMGVGIDTESLPVSSDIKEMITCGLPKGQRSEGIMRVLVALFRNGATDEDVHKIFDTCPIGQKYREKGNTRDKWLSAEISKARVFVDDLPVVSDEGPRSADLIQQAPFPIDALPDPLKKFITQMADAYKLGPEVPGTIILTLASGAIGNTIGISPREGWDHTLATWAMLIGESGSSKSPIMNGITRAVELRQGRAYQQYKSALREYENALRNKEKAEKPILRHIISGNTTTEALAALLDDTPRGAAIVKDELSGFVSGMNQYKRGGDDRQFYLTIFDGKPLKTDRKSQEPQFIPNPCVALLGGIQPRILVKVFDQEAFEDGLLPRFLMVHCNDNPVMFSRKPLSKDVIRPWDELLERCYEIPLELDEDGFVSRRVLTFDNPALDLWADFHNELVMIKPFLQERARIFIPKLITYSLKLTGILHTIRELSEGNHVRVITIHEDTAAAGIAMTRFFAWQAMKALSLYGKDHREIDGRLIRMVATLHRLESQVKAGMLPLNLIRETYNEGLIEILRLTPDNRGAGVLLRNLGLKTTNQTHGGAYHLVWDSDRIKKIFQETTSTIYTKSTQSEYADDGNGGHDVGQFKENISVTVTTVKSASVTTVQSVAVSQVRGALPDREHPVKSQMVIDLFEDEYEVMG